ncbi:HemK family protein methyltransferase [Stomatohabitans albus]|uniref:N5-glutamine methyltransferase family protein n=1 Tax=Stomatohabitans albus TaxID=3110766 RepID=UPI00300D6501
MVDANEAIHRLRNAGVPSPEADWRWISQAGLRADEQEEALRRRCAREPLQLILGTAPFRYLEVAVRRGVFIPRPETEWLVQVCLDRALSPGARIVEPCTGTGAIAAALAMEANPEAIWATDINPEAVALATLNCASYPVVTITQGDLLSSVPSDWVGTVDLLIANPPYLDAKTVHLAAPEVKDWDPYNALVGPGAEGWDSVRDLIDLAPQWLRPGGWLALEDDPARVYKSAQRAGQWATRTEVIADLAGRERFVLAQY